VIRRDALAVLAPRARLLHLAHASRVELRLYLVVPFSSETQNGEEDVEVIEHGIMLHQP
jgi:hypothetical protein